MRAHSTWLAVLVLATFASGAVAQSELPRLQRNGAASQLIVDGGAYIALGGEVHNSSASSPDYMLPVWDRLAALHVNTAITPVTWQLLEPVEGAFDFRLVDEELAQARARKMRLVLLWFGAFKNARSTYAPGWVRADADRFPRAVLRPSKPALAQGAAPLSVFGSAVAEADAKAFARLMDHLREADPGHTVIAVQVENETGLLGDSRDRSALAERAWQAPVPAKLIACLKRNRSHLQPTLEALWARNGYREAGSWAQVFGSDWQAEEVFMAWGFASYVDRVSAAGKARLPLPMYANAWLGPQKPTDVAGVYPSGGPVPRVYDVWKAAAPHLDWLSPDIYAEPFRGWAAAYSKPDNPLFIPEAHFNVGNLFEALGEHRAIAFSPFGIEEGRVGNEISQAYGALSGLGPLIAEGQANGRIAGVALDPGETKTAAFGDYVVTIRGAADVLRAKMLDMGVKAPDVQPPSLPQTEGPGWVAAASDPRPSGLILMLGRDDFLVVGKGLDLKFARRGSPSTAVEVDSVEEGRFVDGRWSPGRTLNGDELMLPMPMDKIATTRIRLIRPAS